MARKVDFMLILPSFLSLARFTLCIVDNEVDLELPDVSGAVLLYAARTVPCHAPTACWLLRHSKKQNRDSVSTIPVLFKTVCVILFIQ